VPVADHVIYYALALVRRTRKDQSDAADFVRQYVTWGAGPRASQYLILGAKAHAALQGREFAGTDDVRAVAASVLRHRIITNFNAEADGISTDEIVRQLIETVPRDVGRSGALDSMARMFRSRPGAA
jgi:MoxR-like ATPase